MLVEHRPIHPN
jgi:hypothetical protein